VAARRVGFHLGFPATAKLLMPLRRLHRRLVAWLLAFCVVFAQTAAAAYACQRQAETAVAGDVPCSAHLSSDAVGTVPAPFDNGNVCEVHCHPVSMPDAGPADVPAPTAAIAWVLPPLPDAAAPAVPPTELEARSASPPPLALFARLLI
jgi:hypothetical protein